MSASAYRAHVDSEKCVACGKCVEICPVGAAKLGQKLCTKDGPVSYPKQELPDDVKWGLKSGIGTLEIQLKSIVMKREHRLVKVHVLHIYRFKAILKWPKKVDIWMH